MKELESIKLYWENGGISKEAGTIGKIIDKTLSTVGKGIEKAVTGVKDYAVKPALVSMPLSMLLAAVAYNKLRSPSVVAKNMDKRLLINTLDTEIAVAKRQIEELESRLNRTKDSKPFDRFV